MNKIYKTQDPKYGIKNNRLVNMKTGIEIPEDEPVFMLRAKDIYAASTIAYYATQCCDDSHRAVVYNRVHDFHAFEFGSKDKMEEPDT